MARNKVLLCILSFLFAGHFANVAKAQAISGTKSIGSGGDYASITAAVAAMTSNGISGAVLLELQSNYTVSGETFPLTIGMFAGSNSYPVTIRPQTGATGLKITSSNTTATLVLNGSLNLTIDGRPGGTGTFSGTNCLSFMNTSGSAPAVVFQNDVINCKLSYCDLQSNNITATTATSNAGVLCIGGSNNTNGNDNNVISYCDIHGYNGGNPVVGIFSYGNTASSQLANEANQISNCNIYDFTSTIASTGLYLSAGCTRWTINNNHFFQTTSLNHSTAVIHRVIHLATGAGYQVTGNYIGGNSADGSGMYTINSSGSTVANTLFVIDLTSAVNGSTSNISSNTITNIDFTSAVTNAGALVFIQIYGGDAIVTSNKLGSDIENGAIRFTAANPSTTGITGMIGIRAGTSANVVTIANNSLSGIDLFAASTSSAPEFHGINLTTGTSTSIYTATNNVIGSKTLANSINIKATSTNNTSAARLDGFIINTTQPLISVTVADNTVANLTTNYSNTGTQGASLRAIWFNPQSTGNFTIKNNSVYRISSASQTTGTGVNAALIGISVNTTTAPVSITGNTVHSLYLTGSSTSAAVCANGIFYSGVASTTNLIDRNFIHHIQPFAMNPSAIISGIEFNAGQTGINNNMISLGWDTSGNSMTTPLSIRGIVKGSGTANIFNNTVVIGGNNIAQGTNNSIVLYRSAAATDDIRNNHFVNVRSNASTGASHYVLYLASSTTLTCNYNNYYSLGTGALFAFNGTSDVTSWSSGWVSGDANSTVSMPDLITIGGTVGSCNLHILRHGKKGISISGLTNDLDNDVRNNPPDIGADEIPVDAGVVSIDSPATTSFCGGNKNIRVRIKNFGLDTITSMTVRLNVNGGLMFTYAWTGTLLPGDTTPSTLVGILNMTQAAPYVIAINTDQPNGRIDNNTANDTAQKTFTPNVSLTMTATLVPPYSGLLCNGSSVTYKCTVANGGSSPSFAWKLNGNSVGINADTCRVSSIANNDTLAVTVTSGYACSVPSVTTISTILKTATQITPTISISGNKVLCQGATSTFTASVNSAGPTPHYQWLRNNQPVGSDSVKYTYSATGPDSIRCIVKSSLSCANPGQDTSVPALIVFSPTLVPSVRLTHYFSSSCAGTTDTIVATIVNGGNNPTRQWYVNNILNVQNTDSMITSSLNNTDSVYFKLTSNAACASPKIAFSNWIGIFKKPIVTPDIFLPAPPTTLCINDTLKCTTSIINSGPNPEIYWYYNSIQVDSGVSEKTFFPVKDKDSVFVVLKSNAACATKTYDTSFVYELNVDSLLSPEVVVVPSATTICSGTPVKFTANHRNGGLFPHFKWMKNGFAAGLDSSEFTTPFINDSDSVWVIFTSSLQCRANTNVTAAKITMTVIPTVSPAISINAISPYTVCPNEPVILTTTATDKGSSPQYQWYRNSTPTGADSAGFRDIMSDKDTVSVMLTSNAPCATPAVVKSQKIVVQLLPQVNAAVSINVDANNICKGSPVTFTAMPAFGGTQPEFKWLVNGIVSGSNSIQFTSSTLNHNDSVQVQMKSSATCAVPATSNSNKIGMQVRNSVTPEVTITTNGSSVCPNGIVKCTANDVNGGSQAKHSWLVNGLQVGTDSISFTYAYNSTSIVKCIMTSNAECLTVNKDTATETIMVKPNPVKAIISRNWDTLFSSISQSYQWYLNNAPIPGATAQQLVLTQNGQYKVQTDSNGCRNTSDIYNFTHIGFRETIHSTAFRLYPNPSSGLILIDELKPNAVIREVMITDMMGRILKRIEPASTSSGKLEIDIHDLESGTYYIHCHINTENIVQSITLIK